MKAIVTGVAAPSSEIDHQTWSTALRSEREAWTLAARFEVYEKTGWRWMLVDDNNEPIATSEPYDSKANAKRGAENVKQTAPNAPIVDR